MRGIEYEPRNVKEILTEMKDTSELMVDLAYTAVLFKNREIAQEVLELEDRMNFLQYHARIALMLAARSSDDAEKLVGIFQIVGAAEKISNAAEDIAEVLLREMGLPESLRGALPEAKESVMRVCVDEGSDIAGKSLGETDLETQTGVHVFAIKRDNDWIFAPQKETRVLKNDVVFCEGPEEGLRDVHLLLTGEEKSYEGAVASAIEDLDKAVKAIIEMKNKAELSVGLAYSATLFESERIASQVQVLESESDDLMQDLEDWVLESACQVENPSNLRGLIHLAISSEVISDAALEMADVTMRDIDLHPVFSEAVRESNEIIAQVQVEGGSKLDSETLGSLNLETKTGMHVMAVRREEGWIYNPYAETRLEADDTVIARGTRSGEKRLKKMARS
ncbi:potassium channel family protein [Halorutilales archaeon Cl-col2-1]